MLQEYLPQEGKRSAYITRCHHFTINYTKYRGGTLRNSSQLLFTVNTSRQCKPLCMLKQHRRVSVCCCVCQNYERTSWCKQSNKCRYASL